MNMGERFDEDLVDPEVYRIMSTDPVLSRLLHHIQSASDQRLTQKEAAAICHRHPCYFSSYFRKVTGMTFSEWYTKYKVERSRKLLARRGPSVLAVALSVGYRDPGTFTRAFTKFVGMTPRAYSVRARKASSIRVRGSHSERAERTSAEPTLDEERPRRPG